MRHSRPLASHERRQQLLLERQDLPHRAQRTCVPRCSPPLTHSALMLSPAHAAVFSRLEAFLPTMQAANEALAEQADDPKRHDIEELSNPEGPHIEMVRTAVPCARFACMAHTQRCLPSVAESRMRRAGGSAHGSRRPDGRADRRAAAAHATNGRGGSCRASRSRPGK